MRGNAHWSCRRWARDSRGGGGDEYAADTQKIAIGKFYRTNYVSTEGTPKNQLQSLALLADAEVHKYKALRSILGSSDALRVMLQRMTLLALRTRRPKIRRSA